jgi:hypothetical protein
LGPLDQSIKMPDRWAVLDATELGLIDPHPPGHPILRERSSPVMRMRPPRADHLAHVPAGKCVPQYLLIPELERNLRGPDLVAIGGCAGGTPRI